MTIFRTISYCLCITLSSTICAMEQHTEEKKILKAALLEDFNTEHIPLAYPSHSCVEKIYLLAQGIIMLNPRAEKNNAADRTYFSDEEKSNHSYRTHPPFLLQNYND